MELMRNRCARTGKSSVFTLVTSQRRPPSLHCDLDQFRRDHFARSTPRSPELDQHREGGMADQSVEEYFALYFDRSPWGSDFGVAFAATKGKPTNTRGIHETNIVAVLQLCGQ
jgi:hypothetical protein